MGLIQATQLRQPWLPVAFHATHARPHLRPCMRVIQRSYDSRPQADWRLIERNPCATDVPCDSLSHSGSSFRLTPPCPALPVPLLCGTNAVALLTHTRVAQGCSTPTPPWPLPFLVSPLPDLVPPRFHNRPLLVTREAASNRAWRCACHAAYTSWDPRHLPAAPSAICWI